MINNDYDTILATESTLRTLNTSAHYVSLFHFMLII